MKEVAFIVDRDSDFYKDYFAAKAEGQRFHDLARIFFNDHDLLDPREYYQTQFLGLKLSPEQKARFANQIKKHDDENGMSIFKKNSEMQKLWSSCVTDKVDFEVLKKTKFWWLGLVGHGSYSLWDKDGDIYGCLKDTYKEEIMLPCYMTEIKMSEYYSAVESFDTNKTEKGGAALKEGQG